MSFSQGANDSEDGAVGITKSPHKCGLIGRNDDQTYAPINGPGGSGVFGLTRANGGNGVFGANTNDFRGRGVQGNGAEAGVGGHSKYGIGVLGQSDIGDGVSGGTTSYISNGVFGGNFDKDEVPEGYAGPPCGNGIFGYSEVKNGNGVVGAIVPDNTRGAGIVGFGPTAGRFFGHVDVRGNVAASGNVDVQGQITTAGHIVAAGTVSAFDVLINGADCAELFDADSACVVEAGWVVVAGDGGKVRPCQEAYDQKVVGVVSGAGGLRPGMILGMFARNRPHAAPIALNGRVFCLADAAYGEIAVGTPLTTSPTLGHAMRADQQDRAFGAVLGKSLASLRTGRALIPILVTLL